MLTISRAVSVTTSEHRAAWDATVSAPKSVSLAALVGADDRIRDAYRESINESVKELEKYMQARALKKGKVQPRITSRNDHECEDKTKPKQRRRRVR